MSYRNGLYCCSDHHKRQESYLEDRCEELKKHNEHLMNFFKMINKQVSHKQLDKNSCTFICEVMRLGDITQPAMGFCPGISEW